MLLLQRFGNCAFLISLGVSRDNKDGDSIPHVNNINKTLRALIFDDSSVSSLNIIDP